MEKRESFKSSFGLFAAAVGSAVGLGNIWRFPYITGMNGGAAFILVYLICVAIIGIPVLLSEFIIGRKGKSNPIDCFKYLAPKGKWHISGMLGVMAAFLILSFYSVIAGWTLEYVFKAIGNQFLGKDVSQIGDMFVNFITNPIRPIFWQFIVLVITYYIVVNGIEKGIEKYSITLIPALIAIIIILDIRALTLPGASEGIKFLFKPDFSKLNGKVVLDALGHSFFSLSLGAGTMITYGSYIKDDEKLGSSALNIALADTLIAILAGLAIFPVVFAYGIAPDSGAGLVFVTLPNVFPQIPGGYIFAILFFLLLSLAAITSTISMLEAVVSFVMDRFKYSRRKASIISTLAIFIVGIFASLSQGPMFNISFFGADFLSFLDKLTANYFMTIGSLITIIFVSWILDRKIVEDQLTNEGILDAGYKSIYYFVARYISPLAIIAVFLASIGII
ncbi:sodium-dependent transporter [Clostridium sp. Cult2]|uniref:sodium-dependent transporter n=1 Tax=Clostridium sp. Cult2 TaxID=2079003 RepID=UPI001F37853C|nr:sodium-dependent transporter [Clostridium sp. Cult2]MCF6466565.1 sodium-dependent transporter [Clostridium sp. Cult2]